MIYDTTHTNIEAKEVFEDLLGKPYSFLKALKLGGVGSKRMMIEKVSPKFSSMMNNISDINGCGVSVSYPNFHFCDIYGTVYQRIIF